MARVAAIVLAAGRSSRMRGKQKMLLPWKDSTIIETTLLRIMEAGPAGIWLITSEMTHEELKGATTDVILNSNAAQGMTTSIQCGVREVGENADAYMICLGDMPLIQTSTYTALMEAFGAADNPQGIVQPTFQGRRGQPVVFSKVYHDAILSHDEPEGCRGIVQDNLPHVQFVEINDPGIIQDIDDPETYMLLA